MRILVFSDSHGKKENFKKALLNESANEVFFLGDGLADALRLADEFKEKSFHIVKGNCDTAVCKSVDIISVCGIKILFTHGHEFGVKSGVDRLSNRALEEGAEIVLYGHTHKAKIDYKDGVLLVCPGSIKPSYNGGSNYAVIDITDSGILPAIKVIE